jgi:hypothetical protein
MLVRMSGVLMYVYDMPYYTHTRPARKGFVIASVSEAIQG